MFNILKNLSLIFSKRQIISTADTVAYFDDIGGSLISALDKGASGNEADLIICPSTGPC